MNNQQHIDQLKKEIEFNKEQMKNCHHDFKSPIFDPESYTDFEIDWARGLQPCGSDPYYLEIPVKKQKPRWSRECKKCGYKQYTYTQKTIEIKKEPDFDR